MRHRPCPPGRRAARGRPPSRSRWRGAALALAACGGDRRAPRRGGDPPTSRAAPAGADVEDQLGFDQAGILARQSRVEAAIARLHEAEGFDYIPIDPFAQRAALRRLQPPQRRGLPQAVRLRHQHAVGPRQRRRPTPTSACGRALGAGRPARLRPRAVGREHGRDVRRGGRQRRLRRSLGGCTRKATEAVFGGAQVLTQLQGKLDELEERILQDQRMVRGDREVVGVHGRGRATATRSPRRSTATSSSARRRSSGRCPASSRPARPAGEKPQPVRPRGAGERSSARRSRSRARDNACEHKDITPVESVVRPEYEARFRERRTAA